MSQAAKSAYQITWEKIRDAPAGTEVIIECDPSARETLIQAIARLKSQENTQRAALGMPMFGQTKVIRYFRTPPATVCRVGFKLLFNMEHLM